MSDLALGRQLRRYRALGLSTKLYLGIAGAVAFTLAASVVAWISFVELGQHQRHITGEHIPAITDSLRLARQSALIAATAPALVSAADEAERSRIIDALGAQRRLLDALIEKLDRDISRDVGAHADIMRVRDIQDAIRRLAGTLDQLDQSVRHQLALKAELAQRIGQAADHHRRLLERLTPLLDDATLYLVTGYRSLDDASPVPPSQRFSKQVLLGYAALAQLAAEANLIGGLLAESANTPEAALLQPLRERFQAAADRFTGALDAAHLADASKLHATAAALIALGEGKNGIFEPRRQLLLEQQTAKSLVEQSRTTAAALTDQVDDLVKHVELETAAAVAASNHAIDFGEQLLFALNAMSIIGAIAIGWVYIARHITAPIVRITAAAADFEALRFDPARLSMVRERNDELGDLARTFTRMAAEVQARTDTLDQLVRERTHELNDKNAELEQSLTQIADELALAQRMQQSILPKSYPPLPQLEMYARMRAAREVGGDFYDIFELDRDRVAIVIADVSGKGVPAALFMAVSCTVIKSIATRGDSPGDVLARVNDILCDGNEAGIFVTVFYGVIDHRAGTLTYANGGHNPPYLTGAGRPVEALATTDGIALGVVPGLSYQQRVINLAPDDTLFFYTDGITEAFDPAGNLFSDLRLKSLLFDARSLSVEALGRRVISDIEAFADGAPQSDDITCVVARYRPIAERMAPK
jgi:serine phosphatase RsbU (regulator of sigma subunit)